jgi:Lon protease-like protein
MFPLGTPLLPGSVLPLYLFEPRYLALYEDIVGGDRLFGVVLIERGRDSGGDDTRFGHGCVAHMVGSATHENGTVSVVTVGTSRLRVVEWEQPRPYPSAVVEVLDDDEITASGLEALEEASGHLLKLKALFSELGADVGVDPPELSDEPGTAMYQMAQLAGLQALDLQRVLEIEATDERAKLVRDLIADQVELVQLQLEMG